MKKKGYNVPTPIQRKAIPLLLAGHDVVAMARTGSGKVSCPVSSCASSLAFDWMFVCVVVFFCVRSFVLVVSVNRLRNADASASIACRHVRAQSFALCALRLSNFEKNRVQFIRSLDLQWAIYLVYYYCSLRLCLIVVSLLDTSRGKKRKHEKQNKTKTEDKGTKTKKAHTKLTEKSFLAHFRFVQ